MRAHLHSWTRWLRLVLACLAVGSAVSPAQVASAAEPVGVVQGGPGKKPIAVASSVLALSAAPVAEPSRPLRSCSVHATVPRASGLALFLLNRALLR